MLKLTLAESGKSILIDPMRVIYVTDVGSKREVLLETYTTNAPAYVSETLDEILAFWTASAEVE